MKTPLVRWIALCCLLAHAATSVAAEVRPNVLVCISDDQSFPHASAYGCREVKTPAFDRVARLGVLFTHAFTPAPGCSPMRAAFLTGRQIWQIEQAGTHGSSFPAKYEVFQKRLEDAGYFVGYTGKGWGPGNWKVSGRGRNPAGPSYSGRTLAAPDGIKSTDYAGNFVDFLEKKPAGKPFSFWYGGHEPHRRFHPGIGRENGLDPQRVEVPPFLPDTPEVREDLLDYLYEVQWFDRHLGRMLDLLEKRGELKNTLVIVTSDNGMAFPYAKANVTEFGIHMPLAISWPDAVRGGRVVDDLVSLLDVTATIYAATRTPSPTAYPLAGRSLMKLLQASASGVVDPSRDAVFSGRERHSSSRFNTLGYPQRGVRTREYLYVRNFRPGRWPAGAPRKFHTARRGGQRVLTDRLEESYAYHDVDASPSLELLVKRRSDPAIAPYSRLALDKRPAEELFHVASDPGCRRNLAADPAHAAVKKQLAGQLTDYLRETGDPRVTGSATGDVFETYPRYMGLRWFPAPTWTDVQSTPQQDWLEVRRPAPEGEGVWPQFRGPDATGRATTTASLPATIGPDAHVIWKVPLEGGHSSPVVGGGRVFVTAASGDRLVTRALELATGKLAWEREAPHAGLEEIHRIGSHAQSSPATDGDIVVSFFGSAGLFCYDLEGTLLWSRAMGPFNNSFGAASSPVLTDRLVLICQDHDTDSFLMALHKRTGDVVWRTDRSEFRRNFSTPVISSVDGRKQIVVPATLRVVGYDLATGKEEWTVRGFARTVCMTPAIADDGTLIVAGWARGGDEGDRIIVAPFAEVIRERDRNKNGTLEEDELPDGGPIQRRFAQVDRDNDGSVPAEEYEFFRYLFDTAQNSVMAIRPGGSGDVSESHVLWRFRRYLPFCASPLVVNGHVFTVKDGGILTTLDAHTGTAVKTGRLEARGNYYSSPVFGDGKVYLLDERGRLTVVSATGEWDVLASAAFGEDAYATPAIVGGRILLRTTEHLYCFGAEGR